MLSDHYERHTRITTKQVHPERDLKRQKEIQNILTCLKDRFVFEVEHVMYVMHLFTTWAAVPVHDNQYITMITDGQIRLH